MSLLKHASIYTFANLLQRASSFLLLPLYTHYLTAKEYGVYSIVLTIVPVVSIFFSLSLRSSVVRLYFRYREDDPEKVPKIWGAAFSVVLISTLILGLLLFLLNDRLFGPLINDVAFFPFIAIGLCIAFFQTIFELYQGSLQARQLSAQFTKQQLSLFGIQVSLTIVFLVYFGFGLVGMLSSLLIASFVIFLYSSVRFISEIQLNLNKSILKEILNYSLPFIPHFLSGWAMTMINRIFINNFLGAATVGIFSVGLQLGSVVQIVSASINQAYQPWLFSRLESKNDDLNEIVTVSKMIVIGITYFATSISVLSPMIVDIMAAEEFYGAWQLIPLISFAYVLNTLYFISSGPIFFQNPGLVPIITMTSSGIGVLLSWFLIRSHGMLGGALAMVFTYALLALLAGVLSSYILKVGFNWWHHIGVVIFGMLVTVVTLMLHDMRASFAVVVLTGAAISLLYRKEVLNLFKRVKFI